jgi:hypothetical protein
MRKCAIFCLINLQLCADFILYGHEKKYYQSITPLERLQKPQTSHFDGSETSRKNLGDARILKPNVQKYCLSRFRK